MLNPLYRLLKAEAADEARVISQEKVDRLTREVNKLSKELEKVTKELDRVKQVNLEQQNRLTYQVTEEFLKMYKVIDEIKTDRTDMKLNVTLVNELVKIHQSLESLKHVKNGRE
jgi:archaellum component FlaC